MTTFVFAMWMCRGQFTCLPLRLLNSANKTEHKLLLLIHCGKCECAGKSDTCTCNACQKLPLVWSLKGTYNNSTIYFFTCSFISLDRSDHDYVGGSTLPWHLYTLQLLWSSPFVEFWHDGMNHSLMKTKLQSRTDQRKLKFPYSIENRQNNNITLESHLLKFLHTSVTFFPRTFPGPFKNISAIFKEFFPSESNKNVSVTGGGHKIQNSQAQIEPWHDSLYFTYSKFNITFFFFLR